MSKKVRIRIDVGGTFTDAVVIDNDTYEIIAKKKIPTTHDAVGGVATGIVNIINEILQDNNISPLDVNFIAHGTTQATNALLEGDVAKVGVLGMGTGIDSSTAKSGTHTEDIELAQGKFLKVYNRFVDSKKLNEALIEQSIEELKSEGAEVIVASEAYSVDDPTNELKVIEKANQKEMFATGGHEISQLYGLKVRTRTAVVNASLIPKMMETANMTEQAVKDANIQTQLMIMRCDGGVMSIDEVRKRPILTMLSGLAAGVAGALMYEKVTDGIFFEVGGTSVDISVIKDGKVMIKNAQVGGHHTYLQSLDVRTLGIAGGSMVIVKDAQIVDVGPRSAHIAGKEYECFTDAKNLVNPTIQFISPKEGDSKDHAIVVSETGQEYSFTLAGAANLLGYVPEGDYAYGHKEANYKAWNALGNYCGMTAEEAAQQVIKIACEKVMTVVNMLIDEYELDRNYVTLVGGGGSASVLTYALGKISGHKVQIAKNAPYISTIGVALAMVREQIEKTVVNPTDEDIKKIRAEVIEKIVKSGANEDTVDVMIEIDAQKNILSAIATGSTEMRSKDLNQAALTIEQMTKKASEAMNIDTDSMQFIQNVARWNLFNAPIEKKSLFGLMKKNMNRLCVLDREGVARLRKEGAYYLVFPKSAIQSDFIDFMNDYTVYSDANDTIPKLFLFYKEKMLDLTGIQSLQQILSIMEVELEFVLEDDQIIAVAYQ